MHQTRQLFDPRRLVNDCGRIFSRPGYQQKYLPFPGVARNKRHARRVPSDVGNGQSKFGGDTIRRSGDIRARAEASAIGGSGVGVGEVRKATTVSLSTLMNSACASQIRPRSDSPSLRNAPTDRQTDRHISFIYIDDKLQCPASPGGQHMPGASPFHFIAPQFVTEPIQHENGGETGRLYR